MSPSTILLALASAASMHMIKGVSSAPALSQEQQQVLSKDIYIPVSNAGDIGIVDVIAKSAEDCNKLRYLGASDFCAGNRLCEEGYASVADNCDATLANGINDSFRFYYSFHPSNTLNKRDSTATNIHKRESVLSAVNRFIDTVSNGVKSVWSSTTTSGNGNKNVSNKKSYAANMPNNDNVSNDVDFTHPPSDALVANVDGVTYYAWSVDTVAYVTGVVKSSDTCGSISKLATNGQDGFCDYYAPQGQLQGCVTMFQNGAQDCLNAFKAGYNAFTFEASYGLLTPVGTTTKSTKTSTTTSSAQSSTVPPSTTKPSNVPVPTTSVVVTADATISQLQIHAEWTVYSNNTADALLKSSIKTFTDCQTIEQARTSDDQSGFCDVFVAYYSKSGRSFHGDCLTGFANAVDLCKGNTTFMAKTTPYQFEFRFSGVVVDEFAKQALEKYSNQNYVKNDYGVAVPSTSPGGPPTTTTGAGEASATSTTGGGDAPTTATGIDPPGQQPGGPPRTTPGSGGYSSPVYAGTPTPTSSFYTPTSSPVYPPTPTLSSSAFTPTSTVYYPTSSDYTPSVDTAWNDSTSSTSSSLPTVTGSTGQPTVTSTTDQATSSSSDNVPTATSTTNQPNLSSSSNIPTATSSNAPTNSTTSGSGGWGYSPTPSTPILSSTQSVNSITYAPTLTTITTTLETVSSTPALITRNDTTISTMSPATTIRVTSTIVTSVVPTVSDNATTTQSSTVYYTTSDVSSTSSSSVPTSSTSSTVSTATSSATSSQTSSTIVSTTTISTSTIATIQTTSTVITTTNSKGQSTVYTTSTISTVYSPTTIITSSVIPPISQPPQTTITLTQTQPTTITSQIPKIVTAPSTITITAPWGRTTSTVTTMTVATYYTPITITITPTSTITYIQSTPASTPVSTPSYVPGTPQTIVTSNVNINVTLSAQVNGTGTLTIDATAKTSSDCGTIAALETCEMFVVDGDDFTSPRGDCMNVFAKQHLLCKYSFVSSSSVAVPYHFVVSYTGKLTQETLDDLTRSSGTGGVIRPLKTDSATVVFGDITVRVSLTVNSDGSGDAWITGSAKSVKDCEIINTVMTTTNAGGFCDFFEKNGGGNGYGYEGCVNGFKALFDGCVKEFGVGGNGEKYGWSFGYHGSVTEVARNAVMASS
ncbi:hypothetical protein HDU76_003443 [Blyttiomyces sp. JEL0837]|nr:hypothetical protein HDU76_003443 [Blyttiomyces sp. JEL0837]